MAASVERQVEYTFIYKQPVYEQLAPLGWQIAKQLSGRLNSYSLSNNKKNYRFRKSGVFPL